MWRQSRAGAGDVAALDKYGIQRKEAAMRIVFVCHSTSVDNELGLASGHYDVPLSETGEQQALELKAHFARETFDAVFSSDLQRAVRTAQIVFGERGMPLLRDSRLRECDYGDLTRHPVPEVDAERLEHVTEPFPHGESYLQATERVRKFLQDAQHSYADKSMVIVGHRATQYGLEYWINHIPLSDSMQTPFVWQPGWTYYLEHL